MENEINFAGVTDRVKAVVADTLVIIMMIIVVTYVFSAFENVSDTPKKLAFIFIFFLYDPTFTSIFGGTIGHMMFGIRVKRENNLNKNILFPLALIRFIIKASLGWISLLTVSGNAKRKALHDILVRSVVVYKTNKPHPEDSDITTSTD